VVVVVDEPFSLMLPALLEDLDFLFLAGIGEIGVI